VSPWRRQRGWAYMLSKTGAYIWLMTCRLTFNVGVSPPVSGERSWSSTANRLLWATLA